MQLFYVQSSHWIYFRSGDGTCKRKGLMAQMDFCFFTACLYDFKLFLQLIKSLVIMLFEEYKHIRENFELQINPQDLLDRSVYIYTFFSIEIFM